MKKMKYVAYFTSMAMIVSLVNVFLNGDFGVEGGAILRNNWGIMSLVDLYAGLIIFSAWIMFREKNKLLIVAMMPMMLLFGFLTAGIYILYNIYKSDGDWTKFFLGTRREEILETINFKR